MEDIYEEPTAHTQVDEMWDFYAELMEEEHPRIDFGGHDVPSGDVIDLLPF